MSIWMYQINETVRGHTSPWKWSGRGACLSYRQWQTLLQFCCNLCFKTHAMLRSSSVDKNGRDSGISNNERCGDVILSSSAVTLSLATLLPSIEGMLLKESTNLDDSRPLSWTFDWQWLWDNYRSIAADCPGSLRPNLPGTVHNSS